MLEAIKENPKRGLYCLDWQRDGDILESWGAENWDEYQRVEFVVFPCNYRHTEMIDIGDVVSDECIADKAAQQKYLGNLNVVVMFTDTHFEQQSFD